MARREPREMPVGPTLHLTAEEYGAFFEFDYPDRSLSYEVHRNVVVLRNGICLKNGLILKNSLYRIPHRYPRFGILAYGSWLKRRVRKVNPDKIYFIIHNLWSCGYYHWITESLPRLRPIMHLRDQATLLLPSHTTLDSAMVRSLKCFGITDIEFFPAECNVFVPKLILPQNPVRHMEISRHDVAFVRDHVLSRIGRSAPNGDSPRRVFISRARARLRNLVNEEEVAACLARRGYARVYAEDLSFEEQVRLMQGAEILVSPHGAGLTNIMFMRPGTAVLELIRGVPDDEYRDAANVPKLQPTYPRLAIKIGVNYFCLLCEPADLQRSFHDDDIVVDIARLEEKLRAAEDSF